MDKLFLSIEEFNELLNQWKGQYIKVSKHELEDLDETLMDLENVSYKKNDGTIDDYQSKYTMQLNGDGQIYTDNNQFRPLPQNQYDIPLEEDALYEYDGNQFIISTERGIYKIEITEE
ncbi:MAG TPA: hypothetical protein VK072_05110 [Candidatus Avamphibacillus sp.]|nr:hypothetical protein [Candidatus Avamphibacillus sp.]